MINNLPDIAEVSSFDPEHFHKYTTYLYACDNHTKPDFDLDHYQKLACASPLDALMFCCDIPGADVKYCQEHACKNPAYAILFAQYIQGSDIEYCRKACEHDLYYLDKFDKMIIDKAIK